MSTKLLDLSESSVAYIKCYILINSNSYTFNWKYCVVKSIEPIISDLYNVHRLSVAASRLRFNKVFVDHRTQLIYFSCEKSKEDPLRHFAESTDRGNSGSFCFEEGNVRQKEFLKMIFEIFCFLIDFSLLSLSIKANVI